MVVLTLRAGTALQAPPGSPGDSGESDCHPVNEALASQCPSTIPERPGREAHPRTPKLNMEAPPRPRPRKLQPSLDRSDPAASPWAAAKPRRRRCVPLAGLAYRATTAAKRLRQQPQIAAIFLVVLVVIVVGGVLGARAAMTTWEDARRQLNESAANRIASIYGSLGLAIATPLSLYLGVFQDDSPAAVQRLVRDAAAASVLNTNRAIAGFNSGDRRSPGWNATFSRLMKEPVLTDIFVARGMTVEASLRTSPTLSIFKNGDNLISVLGPSLAVALARGNVTGMANPIVKNGSTIAAVVQPVYLYYPPGVAYPFPGFQNCTWCFDPVTRMGLWGFAGCAVSLTHLMKNDAVVRAELDNGFRVLFTISELSALAADSNNLREFLVYDSAAATPPTDGPLSLLPASFAEEMRAKGYAATARPHQRTFLIYVKGNFSQDAYWAPAVYTAVAAVGIVVSFAYLQMSLTRSNYAQLLTSILPAKAVSDLLRGGEVMEEYEQVTIMVLELGEYKNVPPTMSPVGLARLLNAITNTFDRVVTRYGGIVTKVEQMGNVYVCAANCPTVTTRPAVAAAELVNFALDLLVATRDFVHGPEGTTVRARIGLHTGHVVGVVLGFVKPTFTLLSDTVSAAVDLNAICPMDSVVISEATANLLAEAHRNFNLVKRTAMLDGRYETVYFVTRAELHPPGPSGESMLALRPSEVHAGLLGRGDTMGQAQLQAAAGLEKGQLRPVRTKADGPEILMSGINPLLSAQASSPTALVYRSIDLLSSYSQASDRNPMRADKGLAHLMDASRGGSGTEGGPRENGTTGTIGNGTEATGGHDVV